MDDETTRRAVESNGEEDHLLASGRNNWGDGSDYAALAGRLEEGGCDGLDRIYIVTFTGPVFLTEDWIHIRESVFEFYQFALPMIQLQNQEIRISQIYCSGAICHEYSTEKFSKQLFKGSKREGPS